MLSLLTTPGFEHGRRRADVVWDQRRPSPIDPVPTKSRAHLFDQLIDILPHHGNALLKFVDRRTNLYRLTSKPKFATRGGCRAKPSTTSDLGLRHCRKRFIEARAGHHHLSAGALDLDPVPVPTGRAAPAGACGHLSLGKLCGEVSTFAQTCTANERILRASSIKPPFQAGPPYSVQWRGAMDDVRHGLERGRVPFGGENVPIRLPRNNPFDIRLLASARTPG
jgi:hypothetical protein